MPTIPTNRKKAPCNICGLATNHQILFSKETKWGDDNVDGGSTWSIIQCLGCEEISLEKQSWFSEDYEITDDGIDYTITRETYPPTSAIQSPEWAKNLYLYLGFDNFWIKDLFDQIYASISYGHLSLATMGIRTIIDHIVEKNTEHEDGFRGRLNEMIQKGLITKSHADIIYIAYDAGSAAAHRGYKPELTDVKDLFDIATKLIEQFFVEPARMKLHEEAASKLKLKTPPQPARRSKSKKD